MYIALLNYYFEFPVGCCHCCYCYCCCSQVCATILQIQVDRLVIFNVLEELLNITSHVQILERLCHISTHHQVVVLEFSIEIVVINFVIFLIIILFSVLVKRSGLKYTSYNYYRLFHFFKMYLTGKYQVLTQVHGRGKPY